jgi:hypothetical protein
MAVCDYCGTTYRGGAAIHGRRFCTHQCRDRGRVLELLDDVPPSAIHRRVEEVRAGPCPECGAQANVDFHKSHRIWSAMFYTTWTRTHFCCQACGRRHQMKDAAFSGFALVDRIIDCHSTSNRQSVNETLRCRRPPHRVAEPAGTGFAARRYSCERMRWSRQAVRGRHRKAKGPSNRAGP